jgi:putative redox protein
MGEQVVVLQSKRFETHIWVPTPHDSTPGALLPIEQIGALAPDGMLLASLGSCTGAVLHTYAQHHGLDLQDVEVRLQFGQPSAEENIGQNGKHRGRIEEEIVLFGGINPDERHRLLSIAQRCSVHTMLDRGMEVRLWLEENRADD